MNDVLDQGEDQRAGDGGTRGGHGETSKDSAQSLAAVPAPLDTAGADRSDSNTGQGGYKRVSGRDVCGMFSTPHDPDRGTSGGTSKGQKLDRGVALEALVRDDAVLNGIGRPRSDGDGTDHFEDGAKNHGPAVGNGP